MIRGTRIASIPAWIAAIIVGLAPLVIAADSGGALPWTKWAAATAALVAIVFAIPAAWARERATGFRPHAIALLILIAAGFAAFQTLSLPAGVMRLASRGSMNVYTRWLSPLSEPAIDSVPAATSYPISIAPWLTGGVVALLVLVGAYAWVASTVFTSRPRIAWLLMILLAAGTVHAGLGFYQQIAHPQLNAWGIAGRDGGAPFGVFINRNNAAALINIGLGCSLGLFAWRLAALTGHQLAGAPVPADALIDLLTDRTAVIALVGGLVCCGGLLASGSRGGLAGGIAGAVLAMGLVARVRRGRALPTAAIALALIAAVLLVRFELPHATLDRLGATGEGLNKSIAADGRLDHWPDGLTAGLQYLPGGAGAGTYRYAYLPFQTTSSPGWFVNADNLWLEWFVEMGAVGVVLLTLVLLFIGRALMIVNNSPDPLDHGLATAGWFGLGALAVTQLFDFGLSLPPTAIAAAVLFSAVVARSRSLQRDASLLPPWARTALLMSSHRNTHRRSSRLGEIVHHRGSVALALVLLGVCVWQAQVALVSRAVSDNLQRRQRALAKSPAATLADWEQLIASYDQHLAGAPSDYAAHTRAAEAKMLRARLIAAATAATTPQEITRRYQALSPQAQRARWYSATIAQQSATDGLPACDPHSLQTKTNFPTATLIAFRQQPGPTGPPANRPPVNRPPSPPPPANRPSVNRPPSPPPPANRPPVNRPPIPLPIPLPGYQPPDADLLAVFHQIRQHSIAALQAAPLADKPRYMLALLDFAGGSQQQSRELLVQLASLRRQNAESLYQIGNAAAVGRMWDLARSVWFRAVQLQPAYATSVLVRIAGTHHLAPHEVIPPTPAALAIAAHHELRAPEPDELLIDQAASVLAQELRQPIDPIASLPGAREARIKTLQLLAAIEQHRGNLAAAAERYGQVVQLAPTDPAALYAHAQALAAAGDTEAARKQARTGQQLAPNDKRFEELILKTRS